MVNDEGSEFQKSNCIFFPFFFNYGLLRSRYFSCCLSFICLEGNIVSFAISFVEGCEMQWEEVNASFQ